jgi:hypothetical protein
MPKIYMSLQLGPMVKIDIQGENCSEISTALHGFEQLNETVDAMFSDLARRVYPETSHEPRESVKEHADGKDRA